MNITFQDWIDIQKLQEGIIETMGGKEEEIAVEEDGMYEEEEEERKIEREGMN